MLIAARNGKTGPGHFGRYVEEDGVEKMSFHYEADYSRGGRSVLAILPLLWVNDWPVAGEPLCEGTYEIESQRHGYALELAVDFVRMQTPRIPFWGEVKEPMEPLKCQTLADVAHTWPEGVTGVRMGDYMFRPHQRWSISPVKESEGYLGGQYYKILIDGTERALTATADAEVVAAPSFTGAPEQLWRIEQLTDGTFRIMPKHVPGHDGQLVLKAAADSTPTLGHFEMDSDNSKWRFLNH